MGTVTAAAGGLRAREGTRMTGTALETAPEEPVLEILAELIERGHIEEARGQSWESEPVSHTRRVGGEAVGAVPASGLRKGPG